MVLGLGNVVGTVAGCVLEEGPNSRWYASVLQRLITPQVKTVADYVTLSCRVVGMQQEEDSSRQAPQFTMNEIEEFKKFARKPQAQQRIFDLIAPQIFGSESIKKAIACLLFGGSRKVCETCIPCGMYCSNSPGVIYRMALNVECQVYPTSACGHVAPLLSQQQAYVCTFCPGETSMCTYSVSRIHLLDIHAKMAALSCRSCQMARTDVGTSTCCCWVTLPLPSRSS